MSTQLGFPGEWLPGRSGLVSRGHRTVRMMVCMVALGCFFGCGGGGYSSQAPPPPPPLAASITISGPSNPMNVGTARTFTATVHNSTNQAVTWSVEEPSGGTVTPDGQYTAPSLPGTFHVKAVSQAVSSAFATAPVPVVIPVGHIPSYEVGIDYHATDSDFLHTTFMTTYQQASIRQAVLSQLQGVADRGATVISTRIWFVTEPGTTNFGETWRATFPMSDQEQTNLHTYAQDVANVVGSGGNRLRLDVVLLWLGAADYTRGDRVNGLGFTPLSATVFTARVEETTDKVLNAVTNILRPDGVPIVNRIYLEGEVMIGAKANQDWFLSTHYPRFISRVSQVGFTPAVYFDIDGNEADILDNGYMDPTFPSLNGHRSMYWIYRSLNFMISQKLPIPSRIDFSCYLNSTGTPYPQLLHRVLDDADASLSQLGAPKSYGAAETYYFADPTQRRQLGQAFAGEASQNPRLARVNFWTTPDSGGPGINASFPFSIEDFYPPPTTNAP
jgi:hypothetical protein